MRTELDTSGLDALAARLRRLGHAPTGELLEQLGEELVEDARRRIHVLEASPEGVRYRPLSTSYARRTPDASDFLQESGALLRSLQALLAGDAVEAGSPLPYAAVHQAGSRRAGVVARPYLGIGEDDADELELIAAAFLDRALTGEAGRA